MALATIDSLRSVVSAGGRGDSVGALDRLGVHDPRRRLGVALLLLATHLLTQRVVQLVQCPIVPPPGEVPVHRLPWRKVLGQHPPRTPSTVEIEDRVDDLTSAMDERTAPGARGGSLGSNDSTIDHCPSVKSVG